MRNYSRRSPSLAPDSPTVKKLTALMNGTAVDEPPVPARSETSVPPTATIPSTPVQAEDTLLPANAAPDDPWSVTSKITPLQDRHFSRRRAGTCAGPIGDITGGRTGASHTG